MIAEQIKMLLPNELQRMTYIGEFPTDADECAAIAESGGPHGNFFGTNQMDTPILKIGVRAKSYLKGYTYVKAIKDIITGHADAQTLGVVLVGDIMYFGRDDQRRNVFQLTYKIFSYVN